MKRATLAVAVILCGLSLRAQQSPAADHAKQILNLFVAQKFDEVAKEFNDKMAAALSSAQLASVWSSMQQQVGAFRSVIDERTSTPAPGMTAATLGVRFEKGDVTFVAAFDADNRIAGLRFTPRSAPDAAPAPPSSSKFKEEAVTVGSGQFALSGTLSIPAEKIAATIVLVHGSGPHDRDETIGPNKPFRDLAWGLAERGVAVLRYEKRSRQHAEALAANKALTVKDEVIDDAVAAVALLRSREGIDPKRIFVLGHSLGGTLAPRIAAADPSIAGLVIMAGATRPIMVAAREQLAYLASLSPGAIDPDKQLETLRRAAPDGYWRDLDAYNPAQTARTIKQPMLILQGERDYQVTLEDLKGWRDALGDRPQVTIKTYPTLNHLFLPGQGKSTPAEYGQGGQIPAFVLDDIANWIKGVK
jgi:dienelactone hydrolase